MNDGWNNSLQNIRMETSISLLGLGEVRNLQHWHSLLTHVFYFECNRFVVQWDSTA